MRLRFVLALATVLADVCCSSGGGPRGAAPSVVSSSLAFGRPGELWVVNPESDSISLIDVAQRRLVAEVPLAPPPTVTAGGRFEPRVRPRSLAWDRATDTIWVAGQSANRVFVVDGITRSVVAEIPVDAAPVSVVIHPLRPTAYVVCHEAGTVVTLDLGHRRVTGRLRAPEHPWGVSISEGDGRWLYVTHLLLGAGVTVFDLASGAAGRHLPLADEPAKLAGRKVPNGEPRGLYSAVPRPGTGELWIPHLLLATKTAQPALDFESTAFPTVTTLDPGVRAQRRRLLFQPLDPPGQAGAFVDSVSGPRALAFTPDGKLALLLLSASEDLMVLDAERGREVSLVRPLPSAMLEGIVVQGDFAYIDGRNTHDVTVLRIDPSRPSAPVSVDGPPIDRLRHDPMPQKLRLGQRLFYTANSAAFPITRNFWIACATCHLEGGTDAVTWLFEAGPRDTPSNAGGTGNTGFLLRQGVRNSLVQYDETINVEQGGSFHRGDPAHRALLDALAAFVDRAIPLPRNPHAFDEASRRGEEIFDARCASCHSGPFFTDSGEGNAKLDLAGEVTLHDIGTCAKTGPHPDRPQKDASGRRLREACEFDTPTLRGVFATAPYFHDGSARTLDDVVDRLSFSRGLSAHAKADLVAYLNTL
jgi:YVTN family beta-propeller protein